MNVYLSIEKYAHGSQILTDADDSSVFSRSFKNTTLLFVILLMLGSSPMGSQMTSRIHGPHDNDVVTPAASQRSMGQQDGSAIAEFVEYQKAIGLTAWVGMKGVGTILYGSSIEKMPATLAMLTGNKAHLIVTTPVGEDEILINGFTGRMMFGGLPARNLSMATSFSGLAPFDLPYTVMSAPMVYAVIDYGSTLGDDGELHRITVETLKPINEIGYGTTSPRAFIDLYFDTKTHLLVKSAALTTLPGDSRQLLLKVITYSNYKLIGKSTLPMTYCETINGQTMWTLTLSEIDLNNPPAANLF